MSASRILQLHRSAATASKSRRRRGLARLAPGRKGAADKGYVLIMTALLIIPLLAFTGFAVDVGAWYAQGVKMQRAADAAALAGVVWASGSAGSCPSQTNYNCVAIDTAKRNGYTITNADITKVSDSRITVKITAPADIFFAGVFLKHETLTRTATAAYTTPVPMGSPVVSAGQRPRQQQHAPVLAQRGRPEDGQVVGGPLHHERLFVRGVAVPLGGQHRAQRGRLLLQGRSRRTQRSTAQHQRLRPRVRLHR